MLRRPLLRVMQPALAAAAWPSHNMLQRRWQSAVPPRRPLHVHDSYLSGSSGAYLDELVAQWQQDPASVDPMWASLFSQAASASPEAALRDTPIRVVSDSSPRGVSGNIKQTLAECARLTWMIQAFEDRGHLLAATDPLHYEDDPNQRIPSRNIRESHRIDDEFFGFTAEDQKKVFSVGFHSNVGGILDIRTPPMTLEELRGKLYKTYCGNIGWEFSHITNEKVLYWLRERIESPERVASCPLSSPITKEDRTRILRNLGDAVLFENTLHTKFTGQKRFGLDGGESLVVGLKALVERASSHGVEEVFMGMAHRGRLNTLVNVFDKPFEALLKEYKGLKREDLGDFLGQGDVKYHMGSATHKTLNNGKKVRLELLSNPSHLECVNPFVQGKAHAAQVAKGDQRGAKVLPIEIHGDAALAGQGIVFETFGISSLQKYGTGGTIHVVVNNQIGFTTDPKSSRSSAHCTDLGRIFHAPIIHVNGDSPEDVYRVFQLAADYRAEFGKSIVIDLVCYRRYGHNESDDPSMTQPLMYKRIAALPSVLELYGNHLVEKKELAKEEFAAIKKECRARYSQAFDTFPKFDYPAYMRDSINENWRTMKMPHQPGTFLDTAISRDELEPVIKALNTLPNGFALHPTLGRIVKRRTEALKTGVGIDWGAAEALALGSLLNAGTHVRISGQDVERATFSQRHSVLHDQNTNETYCPLANISSSQAKFTVTNSSLSEFGVLGFECGYGYYHPNALVMWEAQFGDFANGAQVVFDQFISSGESKWNQPYNVVVSMPHGYDGNGPEHSSGRIERFLQSVNEDFEDPILGVVERHQRVNMEVAFPTTPAQYFHLLRRHIRRDFRKPLINFFSKAFLRDPNVSTLEELTTGSFQPVIPDAQVENPRRLILCSGQIYHYLALERSKRGVADVAIARIEQLAPFPALEVQQLLAANPNAELLWVQEEPKNMGAWAFIEPRIAHISGYTRSIGFAGRCTAASPATGFKSVHDREHAVIMQHAFQ